MSRLCECGCGTEVKSATGRFARGHNRRATSAQIAELFWAKVRKGDGCWEWRGARNRNGYGWFRFGADRTPTGAHRVAYELTKGAIPAGLGVLHCCDNPPCVNPEHLFLGTNQDNVTDKVSKGRHPNSRQTSCRRGHPFDAANTYVTPRGARMCRTCNRLAQQRYARREKEG